MTNGNKNVVTAEQMRKKKFEHDLKRPYDSILKEAEEKASEAIAKAKHITAEYYVGLLCERLRVDNYAKIDHENADPKEIKEMQEEIKAQVINDCWWWEPNWIQHYWPEWAKDQYYVEIRSARTEKAKAKVIEAASAKDIKSNELAQNEFGMLSSVMQRVKGPIPEESQQSKGFGPRLSDNEPATPQELYEDAVRAIAELWKAMTDKDTLPTKMEDIFNERIKPSRKFRQRIIKGLDPARAAHFYNSLVWLKQLLDDTLQMMDEVQSESNDNPLKNMHGEIDK